ncbi:MAG: hypothetical protein KGJ21_09930 [Pseudomonadota bacterium]|nr:hypothetical protein [Pseudomonadota bacterium]
MSNETVVVEINGVKLEVDMRHAKIVHENIKIGSKVKLLEKGAYNGPLVYPGVVVGFENFASLPTIIVAYVKQGWSDGGVFFAYINASAKAIEKWEMVPAHDDDLPIHKADLLKQFQREIDKAQAQIAEIESKRSYFLDHFAEYFKDGVAPVSERA